MCGKVVAPRTDTVSHMCTKAAFLFSGSRSQKVDFLCRPLVTRSRESEGQLLRLFSQADATPTRSFSHWRMRSSVSPPFRTSERRGFGTRRLSCTRSQFLHIDHCDAVAFGANGADLTSVARLASYGCDATPLDYARWPRRTSSTAGARTLGSVRETALLGNHDRNWHTCFLARNTSWSSNRLHFHSPDRANEIYQRALGSQS